MGHLQNRQLILVTLQNTDFRAHRRCFVAILGHPRLKLATKEHKPSVLIKACDVPFSADKPFYHCLI